MTGDDLLFRAFDLVERIGAPLAVAAWLTVFLAACGMTLVLVRDPFRAPGVWRVASTVGAVSLVAHLIDYFLTLHISPDLALEGNPIWRVAIASFGLPIAKLYALTGKILVSILAAQLYAWHLSARARLLPGGRPGLLEFARRFGEDEPRVAGIAWRRIACFFAFLFALLGPYFFYVSFLNWVGGVAGDQALYDRLPGPIPAIAAWVGAISVLFFVNGWRATRSLPGVNAAKIAR